MEFEAILQTHLAKYPLMTPQDCGKLAYQSEYGPEHLAPDPDYVAEMLRREWAEVPADQQPIPPEDIGDGLCRFYLNPEEDIEAASALLTALFCRTAQEHSGTAEGLEQKLQLLAQTDLPGMADWLTNYRAEGCPAVRHSQTYRDAYTPRYRLLKASYARYWPALRAAWDIARSGKRALISIDGRCGSGKTTLASLIAELIPCNVLHMDDYYLPIAARPADWEQTPGGNIDYARFRQEVLEPIGRGEPIVCRAFDCGVQALQPAQQLPDYPLTLIEGSYSQHPALRDGYALTVFVTCDRDEQLRRLTAREGDYVEMFKQRWIPMEDRYHTACAVKEHATVVVET